MKDYPDTSFILSLYLLDVHSAKAAAHLAGRNRALEASALLVFEVEEAIELAMFRKKLAPAQGHKALSDWQGTWLPVRWRSWGRTGRRRLRKRAALRDCGQ